MIGLANDLKISVVVPIYNAEQYLADCVQSVINQTYTNWELLLVDDGSEDQSGKIADRYCQTDDRIRVIHKENSGVSSTRNLGIDIATGDYIMFLDADDELTADSLEKLLITALENNADIVAGRCCGEKFCPKKGITVWRGKDAIRNSLMDNPFTYSACAKLLSKNFIGETRFVPELRINEDSYFVFQLLCKEPTFIGIEEEIYFYRVNPNSSSRGAFSEKYFDILKVSDLKYETIEEHFPEMLELAQNMRLKAKMNLLHLLADRTKDEYLDLEKKMLLDICKNRRFFISASQSDNRWILVLTHHLYFVYKAIKRIRKAT